MAAQSVNSNTHLQQQCLRFAHLFANFTARTEQGRTPVLTRDEIHGRYTCPRTSPCLIRTRNEIGATSEITDWNLSSSWDAGRGGGVGGGFEMWKLDPGLIIPGGDVESGADGNLGVNFTRCRVHRPLIGNKWAREHD